MNPFRFFGWLTATFFIVIGYLIAGLCDALWYREHQHHQKIGWIIGETLRQSVNAIAKVFWW